MVGWLQVGCGQIPPARRAQLDHAVLRVANAVMMQLPVHGGGGDGGDGGSADRALRCAAVRAAVATAMAPQPHRPLHLPAVLALVRAGRSEGAGEVYDVCAAAVAALEASVHPRAPPLPHAHGNSGHNGNGDGLLEGCAVGAASSGVAAADVWADLDELLRSPPAALLLAAKAAAATVAATHAAAVTTTEASRDPFRGPSAAHAPAPAPTPAPAVVIAASSAPAAAAAAAAGSTARATATATPATTSPAAAHSGRKLAVTAAASSTMGAMLGGAAAAVDGKKRVALETRGGSKAAASTEVERTEAEEMASRRDAEPRAAVTATVGSVSDADDRGGVAAAAATTGTAEASSDSDSDGPMPDIVMDGGDDDSSDDDSD